MVYGPGSTFLFPTQLPSTAWQAFTLGNAWKVATLAAHHHRRTPSAGHSESTWLPRPAHHPPAPFPPLARPLPLDRWMWAHPRRSPASPPPTSPLGLHCSSPAANSNLTHSTADFSFHFKQHNPTQNAFISQRFSLFHYGKLQAHTKPVKTA